MEIGILALQGDVSEHVVTLKSAIKELGLDADIVEVRRINQLSQVSALLIPGGESTTLANQLKRFGLFQPIKEMANAGKPIMGTCAGCILLASKLVDQIGPRDVEPLALMDITVNRNAYGRQKESFERPLKIPGFGHSFKGIFIRAPSIVEVGENVEVLASVNNEPVMVRQNNILALTFHPELILDSRVHQYFLKKMIFEKRFLKMI